MQNIIKAVIVALILALATPVAAQDFDAGEKAYERGDFAMALRELRPLAEQGNVHAQYTLALIYKDGTGVAQDHAEALRWFRKAAEQGYADAQNALGVVYALGAWGVPQDFVESVEWHMRAATQGHAGAQVSLGARFEHGDGVPRDYAVAVLWYRLAAEQGGAEAQTYLGSMYQQGKGVPQDIGEAANWYRKAAEQGWAKAQGLTGWMYAVVEDYVQAYMWLSLAAGQGDEQALKLRDSVEGIMTPAQIDEAEKLARKWRPK